jgi:hypothetical protein
MGGAAMSNNFPFELGAYARRNDPATSHITAKINAKNWHTHCAKLLRAFAEIGQGTDEDAAIQCGLFGNARSWWRRCTTLRQLGLIQPTGQRKQTTAEGMAMVCRITDSGLLQVGLTSK